jgi:hypothetical protein
VIIFCRLFEKMSHESVLDFIDYSDEEEDVNWSFTNQCRKSTMTSVACAISADVFVLACHCMDLCVDNDI